MSTQGDPGLREQVEGMIRDNRVMLFMKGTPDAPRCGFSMRTIQVLEQYEVEYGAADVLPALAPLREVTAEMADWQTFPQLYVGGELVGGCDIIEEMHASGELSGVLGTDASAPAPEPAAPAEAPPIQIENADGP
ncbi:MAG: monothiol glutaredoxin family protein [Solirubrobacterales bacterium]